MKVLSGEKTLALNVSVANKFTTRLSGLMFKKQISQQEGLMIPGCNWIHTFFMRFPIDVVYLDADYNIFSIDYSVSPWRFCLPRFRAKHVLELCAGSAGLLALKEGDNLKCIN